MALHGHGKKVSSAAKKSGRAFGKKTSTAAKARRKAKK